MRSTIWLTLLTIMGTTPSGASAGGDAGGLAAVDQSECAVQGFAQNSVPSPTPPASTLGQISPPQETSSAAPVVEPVPIVGWDKGFFLASRDRNYLLRVSGLLQFRYVGDFQDRSSAPDGDENRSGFELARVRLGFQGNIVDPSWKFFILTGHNNAGAYLPLDMTITKTFGPRWSLIAGAFKVPLWREWIVSETRLQAVERSTLTPTLSGGYTEGIAQDYRSDRVHAILSLNDGLDARASSASNESVEGVAVSARAECMLSGTWAQAADFEAFPDEPPFVLLGAAAHYQRGEEGTPTDEARTFRWALDASVERGLGLHAALLGNHRESDASTVDQLSGLGKISWFVSKDAEAFGRYEWSESVNSDVDDLSIVTVGGSRFFAGHALKWTADVGTALNPVTAPWAPFGGWRTESSESDHQIVVRTQLQAIF